MQIPADPPVLRPTASLHNGYLTNPATSRGNRVRDGLEIPERLICSGLGTLPLLGTAVLCEEKRRVLAVRLSEGPPNIQAGPTARTFVRP